MSEKATVTVKTREIKKANSRPKGQGTETSLGPYSPVGQIFSLHSTVGNQAVQGLFHSGVIQAKLKIGQPNDVYEQEADMVADRVMRMPETVIQMKPG